MEAFFASKHFVEDLIPLEGAFEVLQRLKQDFSLHIVTARLARLEDVTRNWLQRFYPDTFDGIHFGNHYGAPGDRIRTKYEMCADINALCLIDDSPNYVFNCMRHNLRAFLFGDYTWNHFSNLPSAMLQEGYTVEMFHEVALHEVNKDVEDKKIYRLRDWTQAESAIRHFFSSTSETAEDLKKQRAPKKEEFVVAVVQLTSINNLEANWRKIEALVDATVAAADRTQTLDLVCLPEAALFLGETADETLLHAQPLEPPLFEDSPTLVTNDLVQRLGGLARKHNVFLSVGGFPELLDAHVDGTKHHMANAHIVFDRKGELLSHRYRKIHLFDCPFVALYESRLTVAGDAVVYVELDGWRVGLTVCYDLRFPALYEALRTQHQVDLVLVPSAFTVPTGEAHWEVLLRARAIENQVFCVAAAQTGRHNKHRVSYGHSLAVDPWGRLMQSLFCVTLNETNTGIADEKAGVSVPSGTEPVTLATSVTSTAPATSEHVQVVRLTKHLLRETRDKMPVHDHRRPDLYHQPPLSSR